MMVGGSGSKMATRHLVGEKRIQKIQLVFMYGINLKLGFDVASLDMRNGTSKGKTFVP